MKVFSIYIIQKSNKQVFRAFEPEFGGLAGYALDHLFP